MLDWIDRNGFIKPQKHWVDSGNGILYSAIGVQLGLVNPVDYFILIRRCEKKSGLYMRTPDGAFGNQSWDDYLGLILYASKEKFHSFIAENIFIYGLTHSFIFNTDDKLEFKDWLGRFVHIWALCFAVAFPWLKWFAWPILFVAQLFFKFSHERCSMDASGTQLQWVFLEACNNIGFKFKKLEVARRLIPLAMSNYYGNGHPFFRDVLK